MKHIFVFDNKTFIDQEWLVDMITDNIGQFFIAQEESDFSVQFSNYRRNAMQIIDREAEKAAPDDIIRVYAIGGEEILFDCLNSVAHYPNMELAIVPHGESNDFLNIFGAENIELFQDVSSLIQAEAIPTDVIGWRINYALNSCYIGINTTVTKRLKDRLAGLAKDSSLAKFISFITYAKAVFDKQIAWQKYKISIDDNDYSGQYSLVHIANGPYHNGKITGLSNAVPDDGLLDIALIKSSNPLKTLLSLRNYSGGKLPKNCVFVRGKNITIQSDSQMWIQLDNEFIQDKKISLNLIPHAVQMVTVNNLTYPQPVV